MMKMIIDIISRSCIFVVILLSSCQVNINPNKIDEELLDHLKHLADTDSLSQFTQIVGLTYSDFYSYVIIGDGSFIPESIEDREPTDIIEYNGKYFLFYFQGKPKLPGKIVDKIWPYLEGAQYSNFTWYFFKCKSCDKSIFTRKRELESYYDIEAIRNFRCLEDVKVDPLVDMTISYVRICGKDNSVSLFSDLLEIYLYIEIYNKSDSSFYLDLSSNIESRFLLKNGNQPFEFSVSEIDLLDVFPGIYNVPPFSPEQEGKTGAPINLILKCDPLRFDSVSYCEYPLKIYSLLRDSLYYIPPLDSINLDTKVLNRKIHINLPETMPCLYKIGEKEYVFLRDSLLM